jgi:hypothetical protein
MRPTIEMPHSLLSTTCSTLRIITYLFGFVFIIGAAQATTQSSKISVPCKVAGFICLNAEVIFLFLTQYWSTGDRIIGFLIIFVDHLTCLQVSDYVLHDPILVEWASTLCPVFIVAHMYWGYGNQQLYDRLQLEAAEEAELIMKASGVDHRLTGSEARNKKTSKVKPRVRERIDRQEETIKRQREFIADLHAQLAEKNAAIQAKDAAVKLRRESIADLHTQLARKDGLIQAKEAAIKGFIQRELQFNRMTENFESWSGLLAVQNTREQVNKNGYLSRHLNAVESMLENQALQHERDSDEAFTLPPRGLKAYSLTTGLWKPHGNEESDLASIL